MCHQPGASSCPASTASTSAGKPPPRCQLRAATSSALDAYEAHDRIVAGRFDEHVDRIAKEWLGLTANGKTVAITASTNQHVDAINDTVQHARLTVGQLDPDAVVRIAGGEHAYRGEVIVTRRNDRELRTSTGEPVRNRDLWVVTATHSGGALTVSHLGGHGTLTLPADYVVPACASRLRRHRTRPPR